MGRARGFNDHDVIEKATHIFWKNGFNGTSMRDLVEVTGLAKASLYNAFGNKEALFVEVLNHYINKKQTTGLTPLLTIEPAREALSVYFDNLTKATEENHSTPGCLLINTATEQGNHEARFRDIVDRGISRTENHLKQALERGIKDGSIDPSIDPEISAFCLVSVVIAIRAQACKGIESTKVRALIEANLAAHAPAPETI
ncbi:MAG: TetR/AcrR family transcriptional regulator [Cohaesibacter sp.]|jgi:TetR/AcrR family transcriptional repressor of nem operon|nr:TetR/AcrR family transcriptional regulator [Cohaesibacter sp.]